MRKDIGNISPFLLVLDPSASHSETEGDGTGPGSAGGWEETPASDVDEHSGSEVDGRDSRSPERDTSSGPLDFNPRIGSTAYERQTSPIRIQPAQMIVTSSGLRVVIDETQQAIDEREINPFSKDPPRIRAQDLTKFLKLADESIEQAAHLTGGRSSTDGSQQTFGGPHTSGHALGRTIIQSATTWRYATDAERAARPQDALPLINPVWGRGPQPPPFVSANRAPEERGQAFREYLQTLDTNLVQRGPTSEWQLANYIRGHTGPELAKIIAQEKMMSDQPLEGVMHCQLLRGKLQAHFDQFADKTLLYRRFQAAKQSADETVLQFWERLRALAEMCKIETDEFLMETHFVTNIKSEKLRKWALSGDHKHDKIIAIGARWEAEERSGRPKRTEAYHIAGRGNSEEREEVATVDIPGRRQERTKQSNMKREKPEPRERDASRDGQQRRRANDRSRASDSPPLKRPNAGSDQKCDKCGRTHRGGWDCPAKDRKCAGCGLTGHFIACCTTKPKVDK